MTIAIVLKPDFTATFTRGILRILGTFIGLLLATALFHSLHTGVASDIALIAVFAFILRSIGPANYGIFVTALSAFVVLLIAVTGVDPKPVIAARALNTAIGGAFALAAYWLWPTWEQTKARPVLADLIEAYRNYFLAPWPPPMRRRHRCRSKRRCHPLSLARRVSRAPTPSLSSAASSPSPASHPNAPACSMPFSSARTAWYAVPWRSNPTLNHPRPEPPTQPELDFTRNVDENPASAVVNALRASSPLRPRSSRPPRRAQSASKTPTASLESKPTAWSPA